MAICTPYLLLILVFIILISPKNLTIFLQRNTTHSTTTFKFVVSVYYLFSLHFRIKIKNLIIQFK